MNYGYFDEANKEYVITKPNTPAPWANYLGSPEYGAIISNNAGGYSFVKSGANGRITRYIFNQEDRPGRYIYLRDDDVFKDINTLIISLSKVLKIQSLTLDIFIQKWLFLYGTGTQFSLELFPSFAEMLINADSGTYLNNQKMIEKVVGRNLNELCRLILTIGGNHIG